MKSVFQKFLADEFGATAIEYGLIAAGIAIAIITAVQGVGTQLKNQLQHDRDEVDTVILLRALSQRGESNSCVCCPAKETWSGFSLARCLGHFEPLNL